MTPNINIMQAQVYKTEINKPPSMIETVTEVKASETFIFPMDNMISREKCNICGTMSANQNRHKREP